MSEIKDLIKVIKSLEKRGLLLKGTLRKNINIEGGIVQTINDNLFTINEKCIYTIS